MQEDLSFSAGVGSDPFSGADFVIILSEDCASGKDGAVQAHNEKAIARERGTGMNTRATCVCATGACASDR